MLIRKTKFSEQVTLTITQKNVQNVYSNWTREDDRFVKHHTEDKWIEDEQSSPGYSKACGSKVGISHHDLKSSASTHGWLWRKGWRVGVMWIRTPLHGEVLTFLDWMLNCSLRVGEFSKMFLLFHPVPPTIYHRISNGTWGQITIPIQVETHTAHAQHNSANDDVQS